MALGGTLALWISLIVVLLLFGRRRDARELARFIPDCIVLAPAPAARSARPRRAKIALSLLIPYLALPFDLVPDFIPVAGQLDDAILVAATIAYVAHHTGRALIQELWPGSERGLRVILALAA